MAGKVLHTLQKRAFCQAYTMSNSIGKVSSELSHSRTYITGSP